ncbi:LytR/AlgR family response regulator transcription factor [Spongiimicrobium salis]|uniref:LytR/AlgR family response regulator transcription factor n=1 Tax=Spongiimicrobium salis TaxID=1667022 RepID=UPI00374DA57D
MYKIISFFNHKTDNTLISWRQKGVVLVIVSFLTNHLIEADNFPLSDSYSFPWSPIITSILIGGCIVLIADLNFGYFKQKIFAKVITSRTLLFFLLSTLGYVTLLYIPCFYMAVWFQEGSYDIYYLIVGLSVTLLLSCILIFMLYAKAIYDLHKIEVLKGKLIIQKGKKKTLLKYSDIAYFYSENKVVYVIQSNGQVVSTDFTLNEIENKINSQLFHRANRQTCIHATSIKEIKAIENGKLSITLEPIVFDKQEMKIVVSRYKRKEFMQWFESKQLYETTIQT